MVDPVLTAGLVAKSVASVDPSPLVPARDQIIWSSVFVLAFGLLLLASAAVFAAAAAAVVLVAAVVFFPVQ